MHVDFHVAFAIKKKEKGNANCKQRKSFRVKNVLKSHLRKEEIFGFCVGEGGKVRSLIFHFFSMEINEKMFAEKKRKIEKEEKVGKQRCKGRTKGEW
jgi:hypothetical protein